MPRLRSRASTRNLVLAVSLVLAACTRPLTERELAVGQAALGETLDYDRVRVTFRLGLTAPPTTTSRKFYKLPRDRVNCLPPPRTSKEEIGPPVAYVGFNTIHYTSGNWRDDQMGAWGPDGVPINAILTLVHELVHVWQWQNRDVTGYHPWRGFREGLVTVDPYAYELVPGQAFLDYGYEQQARMVEDYICLTMVDPGHPYRQDLLGLIDGIFPLERVEALLANPPTAMNVSDLSQ